MSGPGARAPRHVPNTLAALARALRKRTAGGEYRKSACRTRRRGNGDVRQSSRLPSPPPPPVGGLFLCTKGKIYAVVCLPSTFQAGI